MNKKVQRLLQPSVNMYIFFLILFAAASLVLKQYTLAAVEGGIILLLIVYHLIMSRRRRREVIKFIETLTYETDTAKNSTLKNFPLPMAVFMLNDSKIIWANHMFFEMCGASGQRVDTAVSDLIPEFSGKWLMDGKSNFPGLTEIMDKKYQILGNVISTVNEETSDDQGYMGIAYFIDVTEYDNIRIKFEETRPVVSQVVVDNYDELTKGLPDRKKNEIRDSLEDIIIQWCEGKDVIFRRYDRDRYLLIFEERHLKEMREKKFVVLEQAHKIIGASGIHATLSLGLGVDGTGFGENFQFSLLATEMALSRGGDQAVIKNRFNFEFHGGRGNEVETRTKVKSRVMAQALADLISDSSQVFVMGHKYADLDAVGAMVAVSCMSRKLQKTCKIVIDLEKNASAALIERLRREPEYKDAFISPQEAMLSADSRTFLVVVDTNRPEQVEDESLLLACNRVAVIDHHRRAQTFIQNADLAFLEPSASSVCELFSEMLQEVCEKGDIKIFEAEAILSGIVLDTKGFTLRTGERTFEASAFLMRTGANTTEVKKLLQNDIRHTVSKYEILHNAQLYRGTIAIAAPGEPHDRIIVAQAADELLNISGIETSFVVCPTADGGVTISARSIGDANVQVILEKLGGGGNRGAAAAQLPDISLKDAVNKLFEVIDDYYA
ncbi:MAG: DHH family phosphoesterase [Ruminococcaceae bacterium]|nr:DHH family phosphoesterase [Oscillospiraceae bacterium]